MTLLTDAVPELLGSQQPRIESVPPHLTSAGQEAVEFAAAIGIYLDPWQQNVLDGALGERRDGRWAAREVGLVVPRQNGKSEILLVRDLAGLFLFGEELIIHSAHEYKTSSKAFRRIRMLVENNPELIKRCKKPRTSHGEEGVELLDGSGQLQFVARTGGSTRGFSCDCLILDEAMMSLGPAEMDALFPTMMARRNPQIWYVGSAPLLDSHQLLAVRKRGIAGSSPRLAYFEHSADPRADIDDPESWAQANPAYNMGRGMDAEMLFDAREALGEHGFAREILGIPDDAASQAVIPFDVWNDLIDRTSHPLDPVTFAVDITPDRSASSICAASRRPDGRWHVEIVENRLGTAWVVDRIVDLVHRWDPPPIRLDAAGPVGSLIPALQDAGIDVETLTGREYAQACGAFYDAAVADRLRHIDQGPLTAAVHSARKRPLGDAWAWHRKDTKTDISPLVACTIAMFGAPQQQKPKATPSRGRVIVLS